MVKKHKKHTIQLVLMLALLFAACNLAQTTSSPTPTLIPPTATSAQPTATPAPTSTPTPLAPVPVGALEGMPKGSEGLPWWDDTVFYEIFVRSFYDSNGDGIGDLNGIIQKLDYLKDLGIHGVWLMPIFPSPSYHGYDVIDYYKVNPDYGTLDDLKKLLNEAHQRGIRIILDMPLNHTSNQHPWFKASMDPKSPYRNWYVWSDTDPGTLGPYGEQAWYKNPNGEGYYYAVFADIQPDLNYNNPDVVAEINKVAQFWLKDVGVDGFRMDGARYYVEDGKKLADSPGNHEWFKNFRQTVKGANPGAVLLGEVWTDDFTVSTYMKGDQLDLAFDFELANAFMTSANLGTSEKVNNQLTFSLKTFPLGTSAPFLTNHDMDRVMSQLGGDVEKAKNAAALLLTAQGVPFVYYGEEIGISGKRGSEESDINRRLPMQWSSEANAGFTTGAPWQPVNLSYSSTNVAVENSQPDSLLSFYQELIQLRNQHTGLRVGTTYKVSSDQSQVYAILRASQQEQLLIIVNLSSQPAQGVTLSLDQGPLSGTYHVLPMLGQGQFADLGSNKTGGFDKYQPLVELPANTRIILQLQPAK